MRLLSCLLLSLFLAFPALAGPPEIDFGRTPRGYSTTTLHSQEGWVFKASLLRGEAPAVQGLAVTLWNEGTAPTLQIDGELEQERLAENLARRAGIEREDVLVTWEPASWNTNQGPIEGWKIGLEAGELDVVMVLYRFQLEGWDATMTCTAPVGEWPDTRVVCRRAMAHIGLDEAPAR